MAILAEMAIPVKMITQMETMLEEATRGHATIAGCNAISDSIVLTTKDRRKPETELQKEQREFPPLEIEISSNYPVLLFTPVSAVPRQFGTMTPGHLTIL